MASISCRRPRTGPGITSSCGSTIRAPGGASRTAPISPRCSTPAVAAAGPASRCSYTYSAGSVLGDQDALGQPVAQQPGRVVVLRARRAPGSWRGRISRTTLCGSASAQMLGGVLADDVVRWRGDLRESAHPFLGITDPAERREREPGWPGDRWFLAGRKDLHICQKHHGAARIPARRKIRRRRRQARRRPRMVTCTRGTSGASTAGPGQPGRRRPAAGARRGGRAAAPAACWRRLARAQFDTRRYAAAAQTFRQIVEASPSDDYAHFGLGLALARGGNPRAAAEHLALAAAMRPDLGHYTERCRASGLR